MLTAMICYFFEKMWAARPARKKNAPPPASPSVAHHQESPNGEAKNPTLFFARYPENAPVVRPAPLLFFRPQIFAVQALWLLAPYCRRLKANRVPIAWPCRMTAKKPMK